MIIRVLYLKMVFTFEWGVMMVMYVELQGFMWEDWTTLCRHIRGKIREILRSGCLDSQPELELCPSKIQIGDVFWSNLFGGHCGCSHLLSLYVFTGCWNLSLLHLGAQGWLKPSSSSTTKMDSWKRTSFACKPAMIYCMVGQSFFDKIQAICVSFCEKCISHVGMWQFLNSSWLRYVLETSCMQDVTRTSESVWLLVTSYEQQSVKHFCLPKINT